MKRKCFTVIAASSFLLAVPLTGCGTQDQPEGDNSPRFSTIDKAYAAVDKVLSCDPDPRGEPTVPMGDGVRLTSAQKLCFERVQIDLYADQNALQESFQMLSDTSQGKIHLVRGGNWMVVNFSQMAPGEPPKQDMERLAKELNGEYAIVGV